MFKHFFTLFLFVFSGLASAQPFTWNRPMGPQVMGIKPPEENFYFWLIRNNSSAINITGQALTALNDRTKAAMDDLSNRQSMGEASAAALAGLDVPVLDQGQTWAGVAAGAHRGRGALAVGIAHSFSAGAAIKFSASTNQSYSISIGRKW